MYLCAIQFVYIRLVELCGQKKGKGGRRKGRRRGRGRRKWQKDSVLQEIESLTETLLDKLAALFCLVIAFFWSLFSSRLARYVR